MFECKELPDAIKIKIEERTLLREDTAHLHPNEVEIYDAVKVLISGKSAKELEAMIFILLCVIDAV